MSITLSYTTLTYIQKLFVSYKQQNRFLNELTDLKKRLDYESLKAEQITEEKENTFVIKRDTSNALLEIKENLVLLKRNNHCDTFHIAAKNIKKEYERMQNPVWANKLLSTLQFDIEFTKQKFNFYFYKEHSAAIKLKLDQQ